MIKCEKEIIKDSDLRIAYEKRMKEIYEKEHASYGGWSPAFNANSWYEVKNKLIDKCDVQKLREIHLKVSETWLNPSKIMKICKCTNTLVDKSFLRIFMENGETYDVKGNSVQEFMLKNVVLGDDVG